MKKFANGLTTAAHNVKEVMSAPFRMLSAAMMSGMIGVMTMCPTLCNGNAVINDDIDMDELFGSMAEIIIKIAFYVGAIVAISGIFSLVVSYQTENPDGQTRAVRQIVVGVVLIGFRTILDIAGII